MQKKEEEAPPRPQEAQGLVRPSLLKMLIRKEVNHQRQHHGELLVEEAYVSLVVGGLTK
jgi:hypothetical protein